MIYTHKLCQINSQVFDHYIIYSGEFRKAERRKEIPEIAGGQTCFWDTGVNIKQKNNKREMYGVMIFYR